MSKIIALTGAKGSGKDTVATLIKSKFENVETIAFADPIKKVIQNIFGLDNRNNKEYDDFKRTTLTFDLPSSRMAAAHGRHVVREIGMLMRYYDSKQFTEYVKEQIAQQPHKIWIITDLRFDNEYTVLKRMGAKIVKINRPSYQYDGHITERGFDDHLVDHILLNDGSVDFLDARVDIVMKHILEEWK